MAVVTERFPRNGLSPFGKLVNYGNASGPAPAVYPSLLSAKGSLMLARLALGDHIRNPTDYQAATAEVLELCRAGAIRPRLRARRTGDFLAWRSRSRIGKTLAQRPPVFSRLRPMRCQPISYLNSPKSRSSPLSVWRRFTPCR